MKGKKAYASATLLHNKMYEYPNLLSIDEKKIIYYEYLDLIRRAAYSGYIEALFDLAQQYETMSFLGIDNPNYNPKKCIYWYSKACDKGHPEACNNLAALYEEGRGCKKDIRKALELYKLSAQLGSTNGGKNYKIMLRNISKGGIYEGKVASLSGL